MKLSIEQLQQQGIAAHKEGKLQEAERLYRLILQTQPQHPDANHNLGLIAVSVDQADAALPLLKTALEASPKIEQFWLAYIDALIRAQQFQTAQQVIEEGGKNGVAAEKLIALEAQLVSINKLENVNSASPSQAQCNTLLEHYQNGRYGDAEKLALSFTQEFPKHPFGWKVLGVVLRQTGRVNESLLASQKSVQLFPQDAESQNNLGVTLQELGRLEEAEASYRRSIVLKPDDAEAHNNFGNTLTELGRLDEAIASYTQAIAFKSDFAGAHYNLGITLQELGRLDEAEASYSQAITLKPDHALSHYNLGIILQELGRFDEAEASYTQAVALKPDYIGAYNNLGITLQELGRFDEAEASYAQAIMFKSDYAEVHNNLGNTLKELERLDEAEASFSQAITLKPDYFEAYNSLGILLGQKNDLEGAIDNYRKAIEINPGYANALINLRNALDGVRFTTPRPDLVPVLESILDNRAGGRPASSARASISLVKFEPSFQAVLGSYSAGRFDRNVSEIISELSELSLLMKLMLLCPLPDAELENILKTVRAEVLLSLRSISVTPELLRFQQALALQCFINEYIYECTGEESEALKIIEQEVEAALRNGLQPDPIEIACLASYRPLYQYDWCQLLVLPEDLFELGQRQIQEPLEEKRLRTELPILQEITNKVSSVVREQYEEHPYPRWVKCSQALNPFTLAVYAKQQNLRLSDLSIADISAPSILIAGCGTGQQAIETATTLKDCHVLAIDLSLSSLAYAQRKTTEMGITNIEYMQADILDLKKLGRQFDVIESAGVLHHMDDPMAGWRVLTDCLKPGGLMKIGLYSELARRHIVTIRNEIQASGLQSNIYDMKSYRNNISISSKDHHQHVRKWADFYSMSEFRDLLFHVQEYRFTIPQIQSCLETLNLTFSGFETTQFLQSFKELNPDDEDLYDLSKWRAYEQQNPSTFAGMYQFWCQRAHD